MFGQEQQQTNSSLDFPTCDGGFLDARGEASAALRSKMSLAKVERFTIGIRELCPERQRMDEVIIDEVRRLSANEVRNIRQNSYLRQQ